MAGVAADCLDWRLQRHQCWPVMAVDWWDAARSDGAALARGAFVADGVGVGVAAEMG